jgi:hypothetical protein
MWFVCWGVASSIFGLIISIVIKFTSKFIVVLFVEVLSFALFVFIYFWTPSIPLYIIYGVGVAFGMFEISLLAIINGNTF